MMNIFVGLDIGTVSINAVLLGNADAAPLMREAAKNRELFAGYQPVGISGYSALISSYRRILGKPLAAAHQLLSQIISSLPDSAIKGIRVCGSGASLAAKELGIHRENEFRAIARATAELYPQIATVFEIGGQNAKYIHLEWVEGEWTIADYEKSGDCAAGTGSFLDQQAFRLKFKVDEIGKVVAATDRSAKIAGRCSVFAKSDMIHAQQKGYSPSEVLRGLCEAVARNFKSSVVKGRKVRPVVLFIGGVAQNAGVVQAMRQAFNLSSSELLVPPSAVWLPALGAALAEAESSSPTGIPNLSGLKPDTDQERKKIPSMKPLALNNVVLLRDRVLPSNSSAHRASVPVYIGLDIGSVSTNVVALDQSGQVIKEIYTRTSGRPIEVVDSCLKEIYAEMGGQIRVLGVGTTGSGRELIGELVGADIIVDEITAHKTGAEFVAESMLGTRPDTIFEIGGQDSKFISLQDGIVVDFAMNEACAAGTGSFLEERAEELGISIKDEFADLAFSSDSPARLGERCTVFMQQDVAACQQRGVPKPDLAAGLAYSVVANYLNRVVRNRHIGETIFFQGGTAYNNAIAAAFAGVLGKKIIVPPYNGVIGAVGAALLAREKMASLGEESGFRGWSLDAVDYTLREFTCKACSNFCHMKEFTVEGEKTFWGDQCSDKFRRKRDVQHKPVIEDLLNLRRDLLFRDYQEGTGGTAVIGLPRAMYIMEHFPFWNTFFRELGFRVILSDPTNANIIRGGMEAAVAEPCLPIQAYHGHVQNLLAKNVDWLFIPNMISAETPDMSVNSYYCPWGQTLPHVIKNSPVFRDEGHRIISPPLRFREGRKLVERELAACLKPAGVSRSRVVRAVRNAYHSQAAFQQELLKHGQIALRTLSEQNAIGIVLVGRTYNIYDRGMTLDIGSKLRDYYGINVLPMDFLELDAENISDVNYNMFWNYGRKILAAAKIVGRFPNLHIIYLTNFKCGPDSYIKHYVERASGKPFLTLQFDGHSNDAGYLTRCEAYLDSKGALRWWKREKDEQNRKMVKV